MFKCDNAHPIAPGESHLGFLFTACISQTDSICAVVSSLPFTASKMVKARPAFFISPVICFRRSAACERLIMKIGIFTSIEEEERRESVFNVGKFILELKLANLSRTGYPQCFVNQKIKSAEYSATLFRSSVTRRINFLLPGGNSPGRRS